MRACQRVSQGRDRLQCGIANLAIAIGRVAIYVTQTCKRVSDRGELGRYLIRSETASAFRSASAFTVLRPIHPGVRQRLLCADVRKPKRESWLAGRASAAAMTAWMRELLPPARAYTPLLFTSAYWPSRTSANGV